MDIEIRTGVFFEGSIASLISAPDMSPTCLLDQKITYFSFKSTVVMYAIVDFDSIRVQFRIVCFIQSQRR